MSTVYRYPKPEALSRIPTSAHAVIEASAGTGKTYTIEHLVVELLLTRDVTIEQLLIVTFTEKATAELKSRLRTKLTALASFEEENAHVPKEEAWLLDEEAKRRVRAALQYFDQAPISTIHGFCHGILKEKAFLTSRLFDQIHVDERVFFGRTFKELLRSRFATEPLLRSYLSAWLSERRLSLDTLETLLFDAHRAHALVLPSLDGESLTSAAVTLHQTLASETELARLGELLRAAKVRASTSQKLLRSLRNLETAVESFAQSRDLASLIVTSDDVHQIDLIHLSEHLDELIASDPTYQKLKDSVAAFRQSTVPFAAAVVQQFLPVVRDRMKAKKRADGLYDYRDMITIVARALEGPRREELVEALRARYRYALIDEFQDTDPEQWQIFRSVFFAGKRNPLHVVGDPKQAIYGFRGADVNTYFEARQTITEAGRTAIPLTLNFRSTPLLLEAVNLILDQTAEPSFFTGQVRYSFPVESGHPRSSLVDMRGHEQQPVVLWRLAWNGDKPSLKDANEALAVRIAEEIENLTQDEEQALYVGEGDDRKRLAAEDILVLTRTTKEGYEVGDALAARGIPHVYYKQEGLFQTREAEHVRDLLRAIERPAERSRCFRAWMTPFFGLSLSELEIDASPSPDHALLRQLTDWKALAEAKEYEVLFTSLMEQSGLLRRVLFQSDSERAVTNYMHLFEVLLGEVTMSRPTVSELLRVFESYLEQRALPPGDQTDVQRLESDRPAVRIMTMHMSKGLESGIVFLYGTSGTRPQMVHRFHQDGERRAHVGSPPQEIASLVRQDAREEEQRLLYVALTRAAARLYLPYFPLRTDAKGKTQEILSPAGKSCYVQLNQRLRVLVEPTLPESAQGLLRIESVPCPSSVAPHRVGMPEIGGWRPPEELLGVPDNSPVYARLRTRHQGAVITSYTRMKSSRGGYRPSLRDPAELLEDASPALDARVNELPPGISSGVFLHEVLERVPFASLAETPSHADWSSRADIRELFRAAMRANGISRRYFDHSARLIHTALSAPVKLGDKRVSTGLASVETALKEMEFVYPYPESHHALLAQESRPSTNGGRLGDAYRVERGYVKGFVDLVFEHEGLAYFADWKSDSLPSWEPDRVQKHVELNYRLQAQLYLLALVRMLGLSNEQSYNQRFGGTLFAFVRGMNPQDGSQGVFFHRPSWKQVLEWEKALVGRKQI